MVGWVERERKDVTILVDCRLMRCWIRNLQKGQLIQGSPRYGVRWSIVSSYSIVTGDTFQVLFVSPWMSIPSAKISAISKGVTWVITGDLLISNSTRANDSRTVASTLSFTYFVYVIAVPYLSERDRG